MSDCLTSADFLNNLAERLTQSSKIAGKNTEILDQAMSLLWDYSDDATRAVACNAKWQTGLVSIGSTTYQSLILTFTDCNAFEDAALHPMLGRLLDLVHGITGLNAIVSVRNGHGILIEYNQKSNRNKYIYRSF